MVKALIAAYKKAGGMLIEHVPVEKIEVCRGKAKGVWVKGILHEADVIVLSAGCWSREIEGLPEAI